MQTPYKKPIPPFKKSEVIGVKCAVRPRAGENLIPVNILNVQIDFVKYPAIVFRLPGFSFLKGVYKSL
jgi:hypothetical protein